MPKLVCVTCGRLIYTVAPFKALFAEERRCTRCGAELIADRRGSAPESRGAAAGGRDGPPPGIPERRSAVGR